MQSCIVGVYTTDPICLFIAYLVGDTVNGTVFSTRHDLLLQIN